MVCRSNSQFIPYSPNYRQSILAPALDQTTTSKSRELLKLLVTGRSQQFFYGMLTAQAAVIISTFSLAAQKRSLLWSLAAAAGAAAVSFAVYVYLFM